jgi:peptide/nickel transport system ATP-binding protein
LTRVLLAVRDLRIVIDTPAGEIPVVDGVSFDVAEGEIMGLVGESGSGKTMIGRALLRLLPTRRARIAGGTIAFAGRDLARLDEEAMRAVRGREVTMIFQNPSSHLDPVMRVGDQVAEAVARRDDVGRRAARVRAGELFAEVGIADPVRRLDAYPHELSGGMRQRAMIAAALACRPRLLVADEPTTALDVTVQKQILTLLRTLRDRSGFAVILITHDLGVVAETCDSVGVLYAGRLVERGGCAELLTRPLHPYTAGLVGSQPELAVPGRRLPAIPGQPPAPGELPVGCRFHPRCGLAEPACTDRDITLETVPGGGRAAACRRWPVLAAAEARA